MKMIKKMVLTFLFTFLFFFSDVYAQGEYMVKIKDDAIMPYSLCNNNEMELVTDDVYSTSEDVAKKMLNSGLAEFIEPDLPIKAYDIVPNDPYYKNQSYMECMNIPYLQAKHTGKVRVAVIDSGVNKEHPDLKNANILKGYNYVDDNYDISDDFNHGTRVTGVIVAQPDNNIGIAGVAPNAEIVPLVIKTNSDGRISHMIRAINGAVNDYNCKIINISMGSDTYSKLLEEAVNSAADKGVIIIAAAGNDGGTENENNLNYPAAFDATISVGAVTSSYNLCGYSQRNDTVDVSAVFDGCNLPNKAGGYMYSAGTSFAAPVITGITALVISTYPDFNVLSIRDIIKASTADVCDTGKDYSGYGCLMADEIDHAINYKHNVFISPYIEKNTANIKLFTQEKMDCMLICAIYKNGKYTKKTVTSVEFDNNNTFYYQIYLQDDEKAKFFVWNSIQGQKSYSDVR